MPVNRGNSQVPRRVPAAGGATMLSVTLYMMPLRVRMNHSNFMAMHNVLFNLRLAAHCPRSRSAYN